MQIAQSFGGGSGEFDPIAFMRELVESSGVSIAEIAKKGGLNENNLRRSLLGQTGAKLGLEDSLTLCKVLNTNEFVGAWSKSIGLDVAPLPPPQNASDDPVTHMHAAIGSFAQFLMLAGAIDMSDPQKTKWIASAISSFGDLLKFGADLSEKTSISSNDLKRMNELTNTFSIHTMSFPFSNDIISPFAQTISNIQAVYQALKKFLRS